MMLNWEPELEDSSKTRPVNFEQLFLDLSAL